jgi:hypothetical protein
VRGGGAVEHHAAMARMKLADAKGELGFGYEPLPWRYLPLFLGSV